MSRQVGNGNVVAYVYRDGKPFEGPYGTVGAAKGRVTSLFNCYQKLKAEDFEIRVYDLTKIEPEVI